MVGGCVCRVMAWSLRIGSFRIVVARIALCYSNVALRCAAAAPIGRYSGHLSGDLLRTGCIGDPLGLPDAGDVSSRTSVAALAASTACCSASS